MDNSNTPVRAKMRVVSKTENEGNPKTHTIKLAPVTGTSEENKRFYQYTPSGGVDLQIVRGDAAAAFSVGAEYYVDFTRADAGQAAETA